MIQFIVKSFRTVLLLSEPKIFLHSYFQYCCDVVLASRICRLHFATLLFEDISYLLQRLISALIQRRRKWNYFVLWCCLRINYMHMICFVVIFRIIEIWVRVSASTWICDLWTYLNRNDNLVCTNFDSAANTFVTMMNLDCVTCLKTWWTF